MKEVVTYFKISHIRLEEWPLVGSTYKSEACRFRGVRATANYSSAAEQEKCSVCSKIATGWFTIFVFIE
jgi:hypothetical protein